MAEDVNRRDFVKNAGVAAGLGLTGQLLGAAKSQANAGRVRRSQ